MIDLRFLEEGKAIRDPIWGYIHIPPEMMALIDAEEFQRLRDISQLGHVLLVYPGARHSRFEHSLGVFHIAGQFIKQLLKSPTSPQLSLEDVRVLLAASLLHDIGHYPFSHLLEEMQMFFIDHETRGRQIIIDKNTEINRALQQAGIDPLRVANVIDYHQPDIPEQDLRLAHILSGTLDPDKIDYLLRDSRYCGVPFGESVNRDRLLSSITYDPVSQRPAITYKGVSAVEALIFTNYLMYRNVYWHHTVRAATAMFKRSVQDALVHPDCNLRIDDFSGITEGELIELLRREQERLGLEGSTRLLDGVVDRKLHKLASFIYPGERKQGLMHYLYDLYQHPDKRRLKEIELSHRFGERMGTKVTGDEILIDIPRFDKSPEVDLKVFYDGHVPSDKPQPLSFDDPEVSRLRESLLENFEDQAKIFRVFCARDSGLFELARDEVKRYLS